MKLTKKLKSNKGFTLVELVVVIAVLAILAGVGSVAYSGYITRAKEAADMSTLAAVQTAAVAACAEKGVVTEINVKNDGSYATAKVKEANGDVTYNLLEGKTVTGAKTDPTVTGNFKTFLGTNTINLTSDKYKKDANGAKWSNSGNTWVGVSITTE